MHHAENMAAYRGYLRAVVARKTSAHDDTFTSALLEIHEKEPEALTQAYDAVTTKGGEYVQGGGCTTVGVAGLIQGGGFGSFSKHYGPAAGGLLEAEVVTADGKIRVANACTNSDLFSALKGGGGGTYGVLSKLKLRLHDLPEFVGIANFTIKAASDDAYRRLIREFVSFYQEHLLNDHWGEQTGVNPDNKLVINMVSQGLDTGQAKKVWQPFLDWVARSPQAYSIEGRLVIGSLPAQRMWDVQWWKEHWPELAFPSRNALTALFDYALEHVLQQPVFDFDHRPGGATILASLKSKENTIRTGCSSP